MSTTIAFECSCSDESRWTLMLSISSTRLSIGIASLLTTHDARVNGDSSETVELLSTIVYTEDIVLLYQLVQKINARK